jgi:formylglycine-generating enzyme required for sulfatase activity
VLLARHPTGFWADLGKAERTKLLRSATLQQAEARLGPCGGAVLASLSSRSAAPLTSQEERASQPKNIFKECDKCPEMVVVSPGSFTMGSPADERDRGKDEGPQHQVTIGKSFAVGRFAVTFDEWAACVAGGGCNNYTPKDEG